MVQVDLITGFLGAGKTTFLRRYAAYLTAQGHHVCILENDFGAVNVDAMLVQDLLAERCEIETISGGCDCDTHQRRMRTKLISMAMRGFDRVVVEPSGIFDVDEFFDVLRDEPLDRWYTLGNVFAVVDALLPETLSPQAEYILASEAASAGRILLSRSQLATQAQRESAIDHLKRALAACKCSRTLTEKRFSDQGLGRPGGCGSLRRWMPAVISMPTAKSSALMRTMHSVRRISSSWACPGSSWKRAFPACSRMPPAAGCCGSRALCRMPPVGWS